MRIRKRRILPATWPRTMWSLSSFTRNIALGRASTTSPSNSTFSSFAMHGERSSPPAAHLAPERRLAGWGDAADRGGRRRRRRRRATGGRGRLRRRLVQRRRVALAAVAVVRGRARGLARGAARARDRGGLRAPGAVVEAVVEPVV